VTHSAAMYFIGRRGLVRWVAARGFNEGAIPQRGAAIADITKTFWDSPRRRQQGSSQAITQIHADGAL
jgi:hypothetical protein